MLFSRLLFTCSATQMLLAFTMLKKSCLALLLLYPTSAPSFRAQRETSIPHWSVISSVARNLLPILVRPFERSELSLYPTSAPSFRVQRETSYPHWSVLSSAASNPPSHQCVVLSIAARNLLLTLRRHFERSEKKGHYCSKSHHFLYLVIPNRGLKLPNRI